MEMEANGGGGGLEPGRRRRPSAGERRRPPAGYALYLAFLCLPAQEIARCRRVCRFWRYITGTEAFRRDHHRHHCRRPMPLLVFRSPGLARCSIHAADTRDRVTRPLIRFPLDRGAMLIHSSFAGILLLSFGKRLYACNPCTRRWARLPPLHLFHHIIGFYGTAAGFHVLYHDHQEPDCMYWIFKLEAKPAARLIGRPGNRDLVRAVLANGIAPSYAIPPVCYHVYLCWPPRAARGTSSILMFDTVAESFSLIPPPTVLVGGEDVPVAVNSQQLFEMHQHLAMARTFQATGVDVWVRSNITGLWSHLYRIPLPVDVLPTTVVFAVARERNRLLQSPHVMLSEPEHGIFLHGYTIQESLLLHPSILPLQDTDAVVGDRPFFRNH